MWFSRTPIFNQTVPKKNQSRSRSRSKTVHRSIKPWFLFFNRTLIFIFSSNLDWNFLSEPWLKNRSRDRTSVVSGSFARLYRYLTFHHQTLMKFFSPAFDFLFSIKVWFQNFHRDHDRDWKIDPDQPDLDFYFSIKPWWKKIPQTLMKKFQPDLDWKPVPVMEHSSWMVHLN